MNSDVETKTPLMAPLKAFNEHKSMMDMLQADLKTHAGQDRTSSNQDKFEKLAKDVPTASRPTRRPRRKPRPRPEGRQEGSRRTESRVQPRARAGISEDQTKNRPMKVNKRSTSSPAPSSATARCTFDDFWHRTIRTTAEIKALSANNDPAGGYLVLQQITGPVSSSCTSPPDLVSWRR